MDSILTYWFTNKTDPTNQWNATIWFYGGVEAQTHIMQNFTCLIEPMAESLRQGHSSAPYESSSWLTTKSKIATIILLDQFPRLIYHGTSEMYKYDDLASSLAKEVLQDQRVPFTTLPWTHRLFVLLCLSHMEDVLSVNEAAIGMSTLAAQLHEDAETYAPVLVTRIRRIFKNTESHLTIIKRYVSCK